MLHDAVFDDLEHQALSLATINELLAELRADTIVVTLDICFAGTVVGLDGSANREALHAMLQGLAGENRAIAWAASANEPAHESNRERQGYLTMGLLRSLTRAREAGRRELLATTWLNEAMAIARDEARRLGKPQTPQAISRLGPDLSIPVPTIGRRQARLAQAEGAIPVAENLDGLDRYGFSHAAIDALRTRIRESQKLNDLQLRAISPSGVLVGRDILVRAPTSAGKTLIAELAMLAAFHQGLKSIFLVPTRALAGEHARILAETYRDLGLRVIRSAGDSRDDDDLLMGGHFDVAVLTYEKFASLVYRDVRLVDGVRLVVLDEIQLIRDPDRGRTAELLLALLQRRRQRGLSIQVVGLCGDFADLGGLPEWLGAELVGGQARPVPLRECVFGPDGRMTVTRRDGQGVQDLPSEVRVDFGSETRPWIIRERITEALVLKLVAEGKQVVVFRTSRPKALGTAIQLAKAQNREPDVALLRDFERMNERYEHSRLTRALQACLEQGVGFHSSQLEEHERAFLERAFRQGQLRVLVATTTLAVGVNLPANAVVLTDHGFWNSKTQAEDPLEVFEYRNMAGRAGRAGQGMSTGDAYLVAGSREERVALARVYLSEEGSRLDAGFASMSADDRTLSAATVVGRGSLLDFVDVLSNTFWGFQNRQRAEWREQIRQQTDDALERLTVAGLLARVDARTYTLTQAGAACAVYGLTVASAKRVLDTVDQMLVGNEAIHADELIALTQLCVELDSYWIPESSGETAEIWQDRLGTWGRERRVLVPSLLASWGDRDLTLPRKRVKRLALLRNWLSGQPVENVEAASGAGSDEPVLGYIRETARRTADLLPAVVGLVASKQPERASELYGISETLRVALEHGITLRAVALQRLRLGLTRKQALALAVAGITSLDDLVGALETDRARIEGLITTPAANEIRALLTSETHRRRRSATNKFPENLDLFPDGPLV